MLKLQLSKKAQKFLKQLPAKRQKQIALKIKDLMQREHASDSAHLKGSSWHRVDCGEYRIIYALEEQNVLVIPLIGKRNDDEVYKSSDA